VLSASYAEGWGMSLTEAGACGTPSVATDIAGHRGSVIADVTGLLIADPDDLSGALGRAVAELTRDTQRRASMGRAAIDHAQGLSWEAVTARHLDLLAASVSRSPLRRVGAGSASLR